MGLQRRTNKISMVWVALLLTMLVLSFPTIALADGGGATETPAPTAAPPEPTITPPSEEPSQEPEPTTAVPDVSADESMDAAPLPPAEGESSGGLFSRTNTLLICAIVVVVVIIMGMVVYNTVQNKG